jgi:hypothetical protein
MVFGCSAHTRHTSYRCLWGMVGNHHIPPWAGGAASHHPYTPQGAAGAVRAPHVHGACTPHRVAPGCAHCASGVRSTSIRIRRTSWNAVSTCSHVCPNTTSSDSCYRVVGVVRHTLCEAASGARHPVPLHAGQGDTPLPTTGCCCTAWC